MKVCVLVFNDFRHDTRVLNEATCLRDAGHEVTVIAVSPSAEWTRDREHGLDVVRIPPVTRVLRIRRPVIGELLQHPWAWTRHQVGVVLEYFSPSLVAWIRPRLGRYRDRKAAARQQRLTDKQQRQAAAAQAGGSSSNSKASEAPTDSAPSRQPTKGRLTVRLRKHLATAKQDLLLVAYFTAFYWQCRKVMRPLRADVYHANDLNMLPAGYLGKKLYGGKLVYDTHELWIDQNPYDKKSESRKRTIARLERFFIRSADAVITVNQSIAEELESLHRIRQPHVIWNARSKMALKQVRSLHEAIGINPSRQLLLYIGLITGGRGLGEVIECLRGLPTFEFVLMGPLNPDFKVELDEASQRFGVADRIHVFGPVPPDQVADYAASATVSVVPAQNSCRSYYLSLSNKFFESVAAGIPIVSSNYPEFKRMVETYQLGRTYDPDDPEDIAAAVQHVVEDEQRYEQYCANARRALSRINWENESRKLAAIYEPLIPLTLDPIGAM